jgi:hypothetical protein
MPLVYARRISEPGKEKIREQQSTMVSTTAAPHPWHVLMRFLYVIVASEICRVGSMDAE